MMDFTSEEKFNLVKNEDTWDIIKHISGFIRDQASNNSHRFENQQNLFKILFENDPLESYMLDSVHSTLAYGVILPEFSQWMNWN